jgi:hypothetical protein
MKKTNLCSVLFTACLATSAALAAEKPQVISPERLGNYWLLAQSPQANAPNSGRNLDAPSCAAVSYVVEKDGSTSHAKLERLVPDGDLGKFAVSVVAGMQFAASKQNLGKDRVFTYVVIPFNLPDAASANAADRAKRASVLAACKLDNFKQDGKEVINIVR